MRIVRTPDGRVVVDAGGRMPGRGAYVCTQATCRTAALERGALSRALKTAVPPDIRAVLETAAPTYTNIQGGASGKE